jgi:hypothetical protein
MDERDTKPRRTLGDTLKSTAAKGEAATDSLLARLMTSNWTLAIVAALGLFCLWLAVN